MVRCGIAVYGLDPFGEDPAERGLEPALSLSSYVAAVKRFEPGDSAGYGRRWQARSPTWVATVPIGYGDGWRRGLTNDCDVLIGGRRHPLVGTVSMDNVTSTSDPTTDVAVGDEVVLIGRQGGERILAEEVARRLGTINYEVTCGADARGCAGSTCQVNARQRAERSDRPRPGSWAAPFATSCSAGRPPTWTWPWQATPSRPRGPLARALGGPVFRLSERFGAWRAIDRDAGLVYDVSPLQGDTIEADLALARLHA